jgi:hypothetical protein
MWWLWQAAVMQLVAAEFHEPYGTMRMQQQA